MHWGWLCLGLPANGAYVNESSKIMLWLNVWIISDMVLGASFFPRSTLQGGFEQQTKMASLNSIYCNQILHAV